MSSNSFSKVLNKSLDVAKKAVEAGTKVANKAVSQTSQQLNSASPKVSSLFDKAVYNSKVGIEVAKEVYKREHMAPPTSQQLQQAKEQLKNIATPEYIRNLSMTHVYTAAYYGTQIYGFFLVGEIIGRMSLVGYSV
ncbi:hypothetical protein K502DRAFT_323788 [Neoconidiobolus thromboides FSU 785]|nr:hypothetical protein K502DRAFT_323788 [Neoconidiobolus thromboides FSU 785]